MDQNLMTIFSGILTLAGSIVTYFISQAAKKHSNVKNIEPTPEVFLGLLLENQHAVPGLGKPARKKATRRRGADDENVNLLHKRLQKNKMRHIDTNRLNCFF